LLLSNITKSFWHLMIYVVIRTLYCANCVAMHKVVFKIAGDIELTWH